MSAVRDSGTIGTTETTEDANASDSFNDPKDTFLLVHESSSIMCYQTDRSSTRNTDVVLRVDPQQYKAASFRQT